MKINKIKISLLSLVFALGLTACGNNNAPNNDVNTPETEASENQTQVAENTTEESNTEMVNEQNQADESTTIEVSEPEEAPDEETESTENFQNQDGSYVSTLMTETNGERNPDFAYATVANAKVDGEKLIVDGSFDYRQNPDNYDDLSELDNQTYEFKITPDTVFQAVGGLADPEIFTPEEFNSYYEGVKDSGLGLIIEVIDGVVKTVSISS